MKTNRQNESGGILVMVMVILIITVIVNIGTIRLGMIDSTEAARAYSDAQAFWLAEAGLNEIKAVVNEPINRRPFESIGFGFPFILSNSLDTGDYTVIVDYDEDENNAGVVKHYVITSTGTSTGGREITLTMKTTSETFANYIHASEIEGDIWFGPEDKLRGQVYSNDELNIWGIPEFYAIVRSAASSVNYNDSRASSYIDLNVFLAGLTLGAPALDFGTTVDHIGDLESDADLVLPSISGDYSIVFDEKEYYLTSYSGTVTVTNTIPTNGVIYVKDTIRVEGVIDERVSLAAEGAIYITDDLTYSSAPDPDWEDWPSNFELDEDNSLGLFSKREVEISVDVQEEINIHASILTTVPEGNPSSNDVGFGAGARFQSFGSPNINLYGSVAQYQRGIVGTVGGNGFTKNYKFDDRNYGAPPPGTPYSVYKFTEWEEQQ